MMKAFDEGRNDFQAGTSVGDNPWVDGTVESEEWEEGWWEAETEGWADEWGDEDEEIEEESGEECEEW
jgi:hypothetical protein